MNQNQNSNSETKKEKSLVFAKNTVELLRKVKKESKIMDNYKLSIRYLLGEHKIKSRSVGKGNDVWNKYAEIIENRINHAVAQIPRWKYKSNTEQALFTTDMLNTFMRDILWDRDGWDEKSEDILHEGAHAGTNFIFTDVDDEGWPTFEETSIGAMLWDKQKKYKDLKVICRVIKKSVQEIKEEYGVTVKPEAPLSGDKEDAGESYEVTSSAPYKGPIVEGDFKDSESATELFGEAYIFELWMEDVSTEKVPFKVEEVAAEHQQLQTLQPIEFEKVKRFAEPQGVSIHEQQNHAEHIINHNNFLATLDPSEPLWFLVTQHIKDHHEYSLDDKRKKFPFGRRIAYVQDKLLWDKPNSMPIHWRDRWIKWDWGKVPDRLIGKNLGHDLIDPQNALNHRKNSITQNINMLNNGVRKIKGAAYDLLKETGKINNMIGAVVKVREKDDYTVDYGEPLPQSTFQDLAHGENFMNNSGANEDASAGRNPAAGTPNSAIENLIGQFNIRTGGGVRHFALALEKVARNAAVIMREYLPDDTVLSLADKKDIIQKEWREIKEFINPENISIDMESFAGTTRQQKFKEAIEMYREGLVLRKHALQYMDNPDKWQIIQETDELEAAKQQIQMLGEELDAKYKEVNTMQNRLQTSEGKGNVAKEK